MEGLKLLCSHGVVRLELGRFYTARMHVVVGPCCSTSNNSRLQGSQLIKPSEILRLPSSHIDLWSEKLVDRRRYPWERAEPILSIDSIDEIAVGRHKFYKPCASCRVHPDIVHQLLTIIVNLESQ